MNEPDVIFCVAVGSVTHRAIARAKTEALVGSPFRSTHKDGRVLLAGTIAQYDCRVGRKSADKVQVRVWLENKHWPGLFENLEISGTVSI